MHLFSTVCRAEPSRAKLSINQNRGVPTPQSPWERRRIRECVTMSDNIPPSPTRRKSSKRKCKLPTPPPDPREQERERERERDRERGEDFLTYLDHLQRSNQIAYSRSTSTFLATEDAFDHLDKLYKLMEQMLELREQNVRLHRKLRDLEHCNNLEKMRKQLDVNAMQDCPELDKDTAFAETILESILADAKPKRLKATMSKKRNRSESVTPLGGSLGLEMENRRMSSCTAEQQVKKSTKISKWTKVKAAFKWEKAAVAEAKSQDSGIEGTLPVEVARYLRVPSTSEDVGHSPSDSGAGEVYTPATMSTASSTENFQNGLC